MDGFGEVCTGDEFALVWLNIEAGLKEEREGKRKVPCGEEGVGGDWSSRDSGRKGGRMWGDKREW